MRSGLVLFVVAIGLIAMLRSRFAGLLLYTWFTFFRPQEWSYETLEPYRLSMVIGIALLASSALSGVLPNLITPLSGGSFLFLVWTAATAPWAYDVDRAWQAIGNLAPAIIVALLGITLTTTSKRFTLFVAVAAGSLAVHGAWRVLGQIASGGGHITHGIGGTFNDNNAFGLALVRVIFFLIALGQVAQWRSLRVAAGAAIPLTVLAVVFTFSRGAFLALSAGFLIYILLQRRKVVALVAAAAAGLVLYMAIPTGYTERVNTIATYEEEEDRSALGRLHFWRVAVEMAKDRGFGVGLGNFETAYDDYDFSEGAFGAKRAVHNTHYQALAETGWAGFGLFQGLVVWTVYTAVRIRRRARQAPGGFPSRRFYESFSNAIIASTVAFIVGGSFLSQVLSELNWFIFAWAAALDRLQKTELRELPPASVPAPALATLSKPPVPWHVTTGPSGQDPAPSTARGARLSRLLAFESVQTTATASKGIRGV